MYTFICEDSPNGILSGIYDAWDFKVKENKKYSARSTSADSSSSAPKSACTHDDIHILCHEPDNYQLFCEYIHVETSSDKASKVARTIQRRLGSEFYDTILNAILSIVPEKKNNLDKADAIYHTLVLGLNTPAGARAICDLANPYVHRLFHEVYTGVDVRQKKALPVVALRRLLYEDPHSDRLRRTQAIAALMFQFCGMSFADLSHLEKSALDSNVLRYNRVKTKTPMSVEVLDSAQEMLEQLRNRRSPRPGCPDYLFGILQGDKKRKDEKAYREYQSALRRFNYCLKSLAKRLRLNFPVTSYTLRHSWATTAKYRGVPIEMISESLGHKSIKTTQIYLKGFELKERTEVNRMNLSYVKRCGSGLYV
mgnify:FL=1